MFKIANPVGRLIITRMPEPPDLAQARTFATELVKALKMHSETRALLCSDFRCSQRYAPDVTEFLIGMMRQDNALVERAGILVSSNTTGLQVFNAIREVSSPDRRIAATHVAEILRFLTPVATSAETQAAAEHLLNM